MATMEQRRVFLSCGLVINPISGEQEIVVLPGRDDHSLGTEIYNVAANYWRGGVDFPVEARYVTVAQDGGNSFYALGGYDSAGNPDAYLDTIYQFDENTYDFILLEQRLPYGAYNGFGMMVAQKNVV